MEKHKAKLIEKNNSYTAFFTKNIKIIINSSLNFFYKYRIIIILKSYFNLINIINIYIKLFVFMLIEQKSPNPKVTLNSYI